MGVESAAILSNLFSSAPHSAEVCDLLKMYNSTQLRRTKTIIACSRLMGDILEMPDGPAQIERDRQLGHDTPKNGFPFGWADPDLQNLLWSYDSRVEADSVLRAYAGAHNNGL